MEQIRNLRQNRWLSSLDIATLRRQAEERGVVVGTDADREMILQRLVAVGAGQQPDVQLEAVQHVEADNAVQLPADDARPMHAIEGASSPGGGEMHFWHERQSHVRSSASGDAEATAAQIAADEELARRLATEDEPQQPQRSGGEEQGVPSTERFVEALGLLGPLRHRLRGRSEMGLMLDSVLQQLEAQVAAVPSESLATSGTRGETDELLIDDLQADEAESGSGIASSLERIPVPSHVATATNGSSNSSSSHLIHARAGGPDYDQQVLPSTQFEPAGPINAAVDVPPTAQAPEHDAGASEPAPQEPTPEEHVEGHTRPSDRFAEYMARVSARRAETQRRRAERLAQLHVALEQHFSAFAAGELGAEDIPPAGDAAFVEAHSVASVWAGPDDTQCVICVEDIAHGDAVRTLSCGHVYHQECVDQWLQRSRLCCLCKRPIDAPLQSNL